MHYSRTASVAYMSTLMYTSTNDQWARPACLLVTLSRTVSVQFSYVVLYALLKYKINCSSSKLSSFYL